MDAGISNILEQNEKVVWQGFVSRKVLNTFLIISLMITIIISIFLFSAKTINYTYNEAPKQISGNIVGWTILIFGIVANLLKYYSDFVQEYAITKKKGANKVWNYRH